MKNQENVTILKRNNNQWRPVQIMKILELISKDFKVAILTVLSEVK